MSDKTNIDLGYLKQLVRVADVLDKDYADRLNGRDNMLYPLRVDFALEGDDKPVAALTLGYEGDWKNWNVEFDRKEWGFNG